MQLGDPGLMSDYELLLHVHNVHGPVPLLVHTPEHMSAGVLLEVRAWHDELHQVPHNHTHDYILLGDEVAEGWLGVHLTKDTGFGKRAGQWVFACDKPHCYYLVSAPSLERAEAVKESHRCPHSGVTHYGASVTVTLIEECWAYADKVYNRLADMPEEGAGPERDQLRYELRGITRTLLVFVKPFFPDLNAVAAEVRKRHTMHEAGQDYETPGTQTRIFDQPQVPLTPIERAGKVLTDKEQAAIQFAAKSGMFTPEQIASTYNVTIEVVRAVSA